MSTDPLIRHEMQALIAPQIPGLRRYAHALLHDAAAADDLVQDCLERAVGRWHQRRPDGSLRAWLFAILHNLAMRRLRRAGQRGPHLVVEDTAHPALTQRPTQEDGLRREDVLRALDTLPEGQRAVMLLVSVEGMSYAEVAKALDLPPGTVMSRLARGRERLREILAQHEREPRLPGHDVEARPDGHDFEARPSGHDVEARRSGHDVEARRSGRGKLRRVK